MVISNGGLLVKRLAGFGITMITVNPQRRLASQQCNMLLLIPADFPLLLPPFCFSLTSTTGNTDPRSLNRDGSRRRNTDPDQVALGLGSLRLRSWHAGLPGGAAMRSGHRSRCAVGAGAWSRGGPPRPLLDAVQEAHQEDVAGQLVHGALHQRAALGAAQLAARAQDALEAAAAEGVLTGEDLGRGVQPLQAHGALEQIQQHRLVHSRARSPPTSFSRQT